MDLRDASASKKKWPSISILCQYFCPQHNFPLFISWASYLVTPMTFPPDHVIISQISPPFIRLWVKSTSGLSTPSKRQSSNWTLPPATPKNFVFTVEGFPFLSMMLIVFAIFWSRFNRLHWQKNSFASYWQQLLSFGKQWDIKVWVSIKFLPK